ncbi:MAG: FG-GAP repeat domain-containing protein, partial [Planctomycetota bacterium]
MFQLHAKVAYWCRPEGFWESEDQSSHGPVGGQVKLPNWLLGLGVMLQALAISGGLRSQVQFSVRQRQHWTSAWQPRVAAMKLADVDLDGDLDMVGLTGDALAPLLSANTGKAVFHDKTHWLSWRPLPPLPPQWGQHKAQDVAFGDVDGNGRIDIVFGTAAGERTRLFLNYFSTGYTESLPYPLPDDSAHTNAVVLGDVDGDRDLDLFLGNLGQNYLYLTHGRGVFVDATATRLPKLQDATGAVALLDVDRDGDLDVFIGNLVGQNRLYLNTRKGWFVDVTASALPKDNDSSNAVAVGDVDGDRDLDIVTGNGTMFKGAPNRLYLNTGKGRFVLAAGKLPVEADRTNDLELVDLDKDGDLDLLSSNPDAGTKLYWNDGTGGYKRASPAELRGPENDWQVETADLDGNGSPDVLLGGPPGGLFLNDGKGLLVDATARVGVFTGRDTDSIALGDVDGDGDLDLVCGNGGYAKEQAQVFRNDGAGHFVNVTSQSMPARRTPTLSLGVADVDRDGDLDLILGNHTSNLLYLNDGKGRFSDASSTRLPVDSDSTVSVTTADVDGDGDVDLLFGNHGDSSGLAAR